MGLHYDRVRFELKNLDTGDTETAFVDPQNWRESQRTLMRSPNGLGMFTQLSRDLIFTQEGAIFLRTAYGLKDVEARVLVSEYRNFPDKDGEYLYAMELLNFAEIDIQENTVLVPFRTGGLKSLIDAKMRDSYEIQRTEALDGSDIGELSLRDVALTSIQIPLLSRLEGAQFSTNLSPLVYFVPQLRNVSESDDRISSVFNSFLGLTTAGGQWDNALANDSSVFFYLGTDNTFEPLTKEITVSGRFRVQNNRPGQPRSVLDAALIIFDEDLNYNRHIVVYNEDDFIDNQFRDFEFSVTFDIGRSENI